MSGRTRHLILAAAVVGIFPLLARSCAYHLAIDSCMDAGGSFDESTGCCYVSGDAAGLGRVPIGWYQLLPWPALMWVTLFSGVNTLLLYVMVGGIGTGRGIAWHARSLLASRYGWAVVLVGVPAAAFLLIADLIFVLNSIVSYASS